MCLPLLRTGRPSPAALIPFETEPENLQASSAEAFNTTKANHDGMFSSFKPYSSMEAKSRGFRIGPIVADNEGFRIGKDLVAGKNGFRIGNMLQADQSGFRLGRPRGIVATNQNFSVGGRVWGGRDIGTDRTTKGREDQERHTRREHRHQRSISTSSPTSSSSSSSSDSVSSVGSLPAFEDLKDYQLPETRVALENWLNHPDQPITKNEVRRMYQQITSADTRSLAQHQQNMSGLRIEIRELMKAFRESQKVQKRERRAVKRKRRSARRAKKQQKRLLKREERRALHAEKKHKGKGKERGGHSRNFAPFGIAQQSATINHGSSNPREASSSISSIVRGFPFGRKTSAPPGSRPRSPQPSHGDHNGLSGMHNTWPFTQGAPYALGNISMPSFGRPSLVSRSAERIHSQLLVVSSLADDSEARAVELRVAVTTHGTSHNSRLKMMSEATATVEEAGRYRREPDKLRAERQLLDSELAKELDEEIVQCEQGRGKGQFDGVTSH
ncbi:hypothetical protein GLAREA_10176 [Glarea lozoyensis ATCC 20868]|uniref:Uncharacterized protein n=1 Tax=Glarea lozoyensis (strain ATCC 20868 / MF5171) TaxID=1116229 RepID=S3D7K5_GLAL2|nr:uncharacterized protein GLAREA_10176 [Glarea lozoyensis ATCC 20868]EPE34482.1 hypothetical protein GLAREA_10176 [Glarea lozoyensis ATCC 20868]